jgi:hypothetical protein
MQDDGDDGPISIAKIEMMDVMHDDLFAAII